MSENDPVNLTEGSPESIHLMLRNIDLRKYRRLILEGVIPDHLALEIKRDIEGMESGGFPMASFILQYGLSIPPKQAKLAALRAYGLANSIDEHLESIAKALESELPDIPPPNPPVE